MWKRAYIRSALESRIYTRFKEEQRERERVRERAWLDLLLAQSSATILNREI